jgi:hypothetical protein
MGYDLFLQCSFPLLGSIKYRRFYIYNDKAADKNSVVPDELGLSAICIDQVVVYIEERTLQCIEQRIMYV